MPTYVAPWHSPLPAGMPTVTFTDTSGGRVWTASGVSGSYTSLRDLVGAWKIGNLGTPDTPTPIGEVVIYSPTDPELETQGIWVQTAPGDPDEVISMWFEDGN